MSKIGNIFSTVQLRKPQRAKFDLSHERKMSIPFGALIPTFVSEVLPGDSFRVDSKVLARFQAMLAPPMHRVNVYTHFFYVANRNLNRRWTRFIQYQGNRPNFAVNESVLPYFTISNAQAASTNGAVGNAIKDGSLLDYLGFPTAPNDVTFNAGAAWYNSLKLNALLPLAYQRIWSDFYRDQNFSRPAFDDDGSGTEDSLSSPASFLDNISVFDATAIPDFEAASITNSTRIAELLRLRWRSWEKDYLTSATPYANQGIGDPRVPITVPAGALGNTTAVGTPTPAAAQTFGKTGGIQYPGTNLNPTDLGGFTISALRVGAALKRWLENNARGGTRYAESLWNRWFVRHDEEPNASIYLGGGCQPMVISEVVTTAPATPTQTTIPAGYLAGHGISYGSTNRFTHKFKEHGIVMGITSIIPRTSYLYSMPRAFMRMEPLDFATPEFAQIGEQPILGAEVFFKLDTVANSVTAPNYTNTAPVQTYQGVVTRFPMGYQGTSYFGFDLQNDNPEGTVAGNVWAFQSRYAEYKYMPDTVHGLFRNSLQFWHFGRMLSPGQLLNGGFTTSNPKMDNFAVLPSNGSVGQYNQHPILLNVYNNVSVIRSLPYYNTPTLW